MIGHVSIMFCPIRKMDRNLVANDLNMKVDIACISGLHCAPWAYCRYDSFSSRLF